MKVRSPFVVSIALAAAAAVGAVCLVAGIGVFSFRPSAAGASGAQGTSSIEEALGIASSPLSLATFTVKSATDLSASLKTVRTPLVSAKSLPFVALKGATKPAPKKAHKARSSRRRVSARTLASRSGRRVVRRRTRPAVVVSRGSGSWRVARCSTYGIGDGLVGHGMANGGTLRSDSMVVANKTLAFGTRIQFSYRGRVCVAVVADRGPYVAGREFDLGPGTANALGFSGVDSLKWRIVK